MSAGEKALYGLMGIVMVYAVFDTVSHMIPSPPPTYTLVIKTAPESGLPVRVNEEVVGATPLSMILQEGVYQVSIALPSDEVTIDHWEDETGATVMMPITLISDKDLTAILAFLTVPTFECPYCGLPFDTIEEANAHILSEHPGEPLLMNIVWD